MIDPWSPYAWGWSAPSSTVDTIGGKAGRLGAERGGRDAPRAGPHPRVRGPGVDHLKSSCVEADLRTLKERLAEISDLYRAMGVLGWDQKVTMPPGGHPARAESLATLGRIAHEKFVDAEIGRLLDRLRPLEESL